MTSLGEHIATHINDHVSKTPNWISEEMIKCISAIFCKLGDPSLTSQGFPSSPISFSSSLSEFSTQYPCKWSPQCKRNSSFNSQFIGESKEFSGPNRRMIEVQWMCRDNQKLKCIEDLLKNYRQVLSLFTVPNTLFGCHENKGQEIFSSFLCLLCIPNYENII